MQLMLWSPGIESAQLNYLKHKKVFFIGTGF